jgi:hypothetical protein
MQPLLRWILSFFASNMTSRPHLTLRSALIPENSSQTLVIIHGMRRDTALCLVLAASPLVKARVVTLKTATSLLQVMNLVLMAETSPMGK